MNGNPREDVQVDYHIRMGAERFDESTSSRKGGRFGDEGTGESRPAEPPS